MSHNLRILPPNPHRGSQSDIDPTPPRYLQSSDPHLYCRTAVREDEVFSIGLRYGSCVRWRSVLHFCILWCPLLLLFVLLCPLLLRMIVVILRRIVHTFILQVGGITWFILLLTRIAWRLIPLYVRRIPWHFMFLETRIVCRFVLQCVLRRIDERLVQVGRG